MRNPRKKLIGGIILLFVLTLVFGVLLFVGNVWRTGTKRMEARRAEIGALDRSLNKIVDLYFDVGGTVMERSLNKAELVAAVCRRALRGNWDGEPVLYMDGAIVKVTKNRVETPVGFPGDLSLEPESFDGKSGVTFSMYNIDNLDLLPEFRYLIVYSRIYGDTYYIEWKTFDEYRGKVLGYFDFSESIANMEEALGKRFLIVNATENDEGKHTLFYRSASLPEEKNAEDLGITGEMLSGAFGAREELTAEKLEKAATYLVIDGNGYDLFFRGMSPNGADEGQYIVVYLEPYTDVRAEVWEQTVIGMATFAAVGTVFLVWLYSTLMLVRKYTLNERQRREYGWKNCWHRIFGALGVTSALILLASALFLSLFRLYFIHTQVDTALLALEHRIVENEAHTRLTEDLNRKVYEIFTSMTAQLMSEYPDVVTAEDFQSICDATGADYMMLFDTEGNEVLSNSEYRGLRLGEEETSATYEFRRLLNGVPLISHASALDEQTLMSDVLIGARVGKAEDEAGYGALLMAVPPDKIYNSNAETVEDIMSSLVYDGMLAFSVDRESGLILAASDPELVGWTAAELGMKEKSLQDGFQDFFTLNGVSYYGECKADGGVLYCYAEENDHVYKGIPGYSALIALFAFVLLLILAAYLMSGYRKDFEEYANIGELLKDSMNEVKVSGDKWKRSKDPAMRWRLDAPENANLMPIDHAKIAMRILFLIGLVWIVGNMYIGRPNTTGALMSFIVKGQWTKGFNLFALTAIVILLWEVILAVSALKLVIYFLSNALGTRGETVCRLLLNIVNYSGVLFFLYYALYYLGFSPGTLLASLGLMTFAVSLGAKDLVTDVLAGLSIVFEGEYQVGDIIDIGGYRGEVLEIGVRTTKIEGRGGNIKIIGNRDVKNVVNMTRKNSWYPLEISIPSDQSLDAVEQLLAEQLPKIGAAIPEIISGPYYKGVSAIGRGSMTLSIITECSEEDYHKVQRAVNRAVHKLLSGQGIKIL